MPESVIARISRLRTMTVGELRDQWFTLYGEETRSRNRDFLRRRLSWRIQEIEFGGLSDRARSRLQELADGLDFRRARTPDNIMSEPACTRPVAAKHRRDPRLPTPGTLISKIYKGRELRLTVHDDGYEFEGSMYSSLTALAKHITGCRSINGKLFWGLTTRKRK